MLKAVILVGGDNKGTRFRPLSLDIPKPLFPIAGLPIIEHHIHACSAMSNLEEILIIGSYHINEMITFLNEVKTKYHVTIRYLQEFVELGTAGGIYHFRDQIRAGNPECFFVLNGDVCADFPLQQLYDFHITKKDALISILSTEADRVESVNYGCIVTDKGTGEVTHYVEKPSSYVSPLINCGVYLANIEIFPQIATVFYSRPKNENFSGNGSGNGKDQGHIQLEQEVLTPLAGSGKLYTLTLNMKWAQVKNAASAIYANRQALELRRKSHPEKFSDQFNCTIIGNVFIHPTAQISETAVLGPNVSIGKGVIIAAGVRIRESIILDDTFIDEHTLIIHSIIGRKTKVGKWSRIEGTAVDPDPNKPFAKIKNLPLFNTEGKMNPSTTILGHNSSVASEIILLNSIVLPSKELGRSFKNEIIL
ncbi:CLUMA_CG015319, isoform A [Clunio marinus]|uniref:CLUMA_CG015319, isoform A n=1 Tax=Clunio marinus TaxID=568069 RepID=A0A1J1IS78_9DIPT|nr:CLUMA_CG015319, isoform A [Clunio marinus]